MTVTRCQTCRTRSTELETFTDSIPERLGLTRTRERIVVVTRLDCGHDNVTETGEVVNA